MNWIVACRGNVSPSLFNGSGISGLIGWNLVSMPMAKRSKLRLNSGSCHREIFERDPPEDKTKRMKRSLRDPPSNPIPCFLERNLLLSKLSKLMSLKLEMMETNEILFGRKERRSKKGKLARRNWSYGCNAQRSTVSISDVIYELCRNSISYDNLTSGTILHCRKYQMKNYFEFCGSECKWAIQKLDLEKWNKYIAKFNSFQNHWRLAKPHCVRFP